MNRHSKAAALGRVIGHLTAISGMGACVAIIVVGCAFNQGGGWLPYVAGFFLVVSFLIGGIWLAVLGPPKDLPEHVREIRWSWQTRLLLLLGGALLSVPMTRWPLRLTFAASAASLNRLADEVGAGHAPPGPVRAGLFTIEATEICKTLDGHKVVCLWTAGYPGKGKLGFARPAGPSSKPDDGIHDLAPWPLTGQWETIDQD